MADEPKPAVLNFPVMFGNVKRDIPLLPTMSLKVARLHVYDQIGKMLKGNSLTEALKALGLT